MKQQPDFLSLSSKTSKTFRKTQTIFLLDAGTKQIMFQLPEFFKLHAHTSSSGYTNTMHFTQKTGRIEVFGGDRKLCQNFSNCKINLCSFITRYIYELIP